MAEVQSPIHRVCSIWQLILLGRAGLGLSWIMFPVSSTQVDGTHITSIPAGNGKVWEAA